MQNEYFEFPKCPNCERETFFCFDEWGHTPYHLHCNFCDINIGASSPNECVDLFQRYNKPKTYIEYYHKSIQIMFENNKCIINKEAVYNAE